MDGQLAFVLVDEPRRDRVAVATHGFEDDRSQGHLMPSSGHPRDRSCPSSCPSRHRNRMGRARFLAPPQRSDQPLRVSLRSTRHAQRDSSTVRRRFESGRGRQADGKRGSRLARDGLAPFSGPGRVASPSWLPRPTGVAAAVRAACSAPWTPGSVFVAHDDAAQGVTCSAVVGDPQTERVEQRPQGGLGSLAECGGVGFEKLAQQFTCARTAPLAPASR